MPTIKIDPQDVETIITHEDELKESVRRSIEHLRSLPPEELEALIQKMMQPAVPVKPFPRTYKPKGGA